MQNSLPERWLEMGKRHIIFMQDTNILSLFGFAPLLGVSIQNSLDFSSLGIVRKPGEKIGSICRLEYPDSRKLTCNIEYNEFESLLRRLTGEGDEPNDNGNSSYPGNINILCASIASYNRILLQTHGSIPEFINPKFADASHRFFSSPARLECMMQDLPKIMTQKETVGYCSLPRWICFSAAKNSYENAAIQESRTGFGESLFSAEEDYYKWFRKVGRKFGIEVGTQEWDDSVTPAYGVPQLPLLVLSPQAVLTVSDMKKRFTGEITMSPRSVVYIDGIDVTMENVSVDGALVVRACPDAKVIIRNIAVQNKGWKFEYCSGDPARSWKIDKLMIRRYILRKMETTEYIFNEPGYYVIECCICL